MYRRTSTVFRVNVRFGSFVVVDDLKANLVHGNASSRQDLRGPVYLICYWDFDAISGGIPIPNGVGS